MWKRWPKNYSAFRLSYGSRGPGGACQELLIRCLYISQDDNGEYFERRCESAMAVSVSVFQRCLRRPRTSDQLKDVHRLQRDDVQLMQLILSSVNYVRAERVTGGIHKAVTLCMGAPGLNIDWS
jgi:hypothetical protein